MRKILTITLCVILTCSFALTGCNKGKKGNEDDKISVILTSIGNNLDPIAANFTDVCIIANHIYDRILKMDEHFNIIPGVAESYETPDNQTIKLTIGDGYKFHNGEPMEIEDVVYSIERQKDIAEAAPFVNDIKSVEADGKVVTINLTEPNVGLITWLCRTIVVNKSYCLSVGDEYANKPIGTGPYKLVEFVPGEKAVLEAWEDYPSQKAKIKQITFKGIGEKAARYMSVESGDNDFAPISSEDIERAKNNEALNFNQVEGTLCNFVSMNTTKPPFDNANVRRAMAYAYNKEGFAKLIPGQEVIQSMTPKMFDIYYESPDVPKYNLDKAKELLAAEGYNESNPLTFEFAAYKVGDPTIPAFQADLASIGVKMEIKNYEFGVFLQNMMNQEYQMLGGGWANDGNPLSALECYATVSFGANNISFYSNPECDELYRRAKATTDKTELKEIAKQIENIAARDCPIIPVSSLPYYYVSIKALSGVELHPDGTVSFRNAFLVH